MSMEFLQRIKSLEARNAVLEDRVAKLEDYITGVEANDSLEDFANDVSPIKRKRGRPRKDEGHGRPDLPPAA